MPTFKVWFVKKMQASRTVEAESLEAAKEAGRLLEGEIQDSDAELVRNWRANIAVPEGQPAPEI